jgi:hypothetical protein
MFFYAQQSHNALNDLDQGTLTSVEQATHAPKAVQQHRPLLESSGKSLAQGKMLKGNGHNYCGPNDPSVL